MSDAPFISMKFDLPPAELRRHVATLIAHGLYQAKLPWLPGEKIKVADLEGVANFVIGGMLGLEKQAAKGKTDGAQN